jgi:hypothetical protein
LHVQQAQFAVIQDTLVKNTHDIRVVQLRQRPGLVAVMG